jgi:hypothetical protein
MTDSTMKPSVTLALTTRNRTAYLAEVVQCVLAQDYSNLDILISDNGSSDGTPELARALVLSDPRVRFRRNETAVPQNEHFTQCTLAARGDYFILLHDDDRINSSFVSELVAVAVEYPDVNVVLPANVTIDQKGVITRRFGLPDDAVFDGPNFIVDYWLCVRGPQLLACLTTILIKTQTVMRFGGYRHFTSGRNIDNLLFLQCGLVGRIGFAPRAIFEYREHSSSLGRAAKPEDIASSGREFLEYLQRDPRTADLLCALPDKRGEQILRAVARATTKEVILQMDEVRAPFDAQGVWRLLLKRHDKIFCFLLIAEFVRHTLPALYAILRWARHAAGLRSRRVESDSPLP